MHLLAGKDACHLLPWPSWTWWPMANSPSAAPESETDRSNSQVLRLFNVFSFQKIKLERERVGGMATATTTSKMHEGGLSDFFNKSGWRPRDKQMEPLEKTKRVRKRKELPKRRILSSLKYWLRTWGQKSISSAPVPSLMMAASFHCPPLTSSLLRIVYTKPCDATKSMKMQQ